MKNRSILRFKFKKEVIDENFSVKEFRARIDKISEKMNKIPDDVKIKKFDIDEIYSEWIIPSNALDKKVLMYIHGGGFISGNCNSHRMHVAKFAKNSGVSCLLFDYRLAPENKFPSAVEDCLKLYDWLLNNGYKSSDIVIGGESAGGTLTLSTLLAIKDSKRPFPKAAFSISPVTDLRCESPSFKYNAKKDINPMNSSTIWTKFYFGDTDVKNPILSPLFGNLNGLPPLLICVGTHEVHYDDAMNFGEKAKKAGVDVKMSIWKNMIHAFPIMSPLFPEAKKAMNEICKFVRENLNKITD